MAMDLEFFLSERAIFSNRCASAIGASHTTAFKKLLLFRIKPVDMAILPRRTRAPSYRARLVVAESTGIKLLNTAQVSTSIPHTAVSASARRRIHSRLNQKSTPDFSSTPAKTARRTQQARHERCSLRLPRTVRSESVVASVGSSMSIA